MAATQVVHPGDERGVLAALTVMGTELEVAGGLERVLQCVVRELAEHYRLDCAALCVDIQVPALVCTARRGHDGRVRLTSAPPARREESVQLCIGGLTLGEIVIERTPEPLSPAERAEIRALAPWLAGQLLAAWLLTEIEEQNRGLQEREEELRGLALRVMEIRDDEQRRIALDIHDDALQRALLLKRSLSHCRSDSDTEGSSVTTAQLDGLIDALRRMCQGLRPQALEDFGLQAGLRWLAADAQTRCHCLVQLAAEASDRDDFGRLPAQLELALFRVAQEAVNNAAKHAACHQILITLWREADWIGLRVADDGHGFTSARDGTAHLGLTSMRERLRPWGGHVTVESEPGQGTTVTAEVPCPDAP